MRAKRQDPGVGAKPATGRYQRWGNKPAIQTIPYKPMESPTIEQENLFHLSAQLYSHIQSDPNLSPSSRIVRVDGVAGCGKTATCVEDAVRLHKLGADLRFLAFGERASRESEGKLRGAGLEGLSTTSHVYGKSIIAENRVSRKPPPIDKNKLLNILDTYVERKHQKLKWRLKRSAEICMAFLLFGDNETDSDYEIALDLIHEHDIMFGLTDTLVPNAVAMVDATRKLVKKSLHEKDVIDFSDMVCLPGYRNYEPKHTFDILFADEYQDTNRAQEYLLLSAARVLIAVGDPNQAIYGFRGAGTDSMDRLFTLGGALGSTVYLNSLSFNWRCDASIIRLAQKLVPRIQAKPNAREGVVDSESMSAIISLLKYKQVLLESNMVISRVNSALFKYQIALLLARIPAIRVGGSGSGSVDGLIRDMLTKVGDCRTLEDSKKALMISRDDALGKITVEGLGAGGEESARSSRAKRSRVSRIEDLYACCFELLSESDTVADALTLLDTLAPGKDVSSSGLTTSTGAVSLMTIHGSKGLEASNVYVVGNEKFGQGIFLAGCEEDVEDDVDEDLTQVGELRCNDQELNIAYVAVTRAEHNLVFENEIPWFLC